MFLLSIRRLNINPTNRTAVKTALGRYMQLGAVRNFKSLQILAMFKLLVQIIEVCFTQVRRL